MEKTRLGGPFESFKKKDNFLAFAYFFCRVLGLIGKRSYSRWPIQSSTALAIIEELRHDVQGPNVLGLSLGYRRRKTA